ncbi:hypothetical protein CHS0354_001861 [Potamilus streckersoni]|uniref:Methyltransferase FkbM domain-containing protein n=1 Tax=Potamilus streckersoni TaxID=2493646 RepID=A0AAE0S6V9_9BIVA|nr:hypothetical protein CHS0354_001861 [Potamilus streckersoni]
MVTVKLVEPERGFFVEAGAWLGEYASTSLFFEKSRGWTGLLVEPNPENFQKLKSLNRKAFHINACLSTHPFPVVLMLNAASDMSRTIEKMEDKQWVQEHKFDQKPYYEVPCFPLYSIMLAINRTSIDYFGLDVEGNELQILETIPFDDLDIKSLTAECLEMYGRGKERAEEVKAFLESKGYRCRGIIEANPQHSCFAEDLVFIKEDLISQKYKCEPITNPFGSNNALHIEKNGKGTKIIKMSNVNSAQ